MVHNSDKNSQQDWDDFNNELSGLEVGRLQRFISTASDHSPQAQEKKREKEAHASMLAYLLAEDPIYAKLYFEVEQDLNDAQEAVNAARADINSELAMCSANIQLMEDNATRLDDGTMVFRSENGDVYTQDGLKLDDDVAKNIAFGSHSPSWESYKAEQDKAEQLRIQRQELDIYQRDTIDHIRTRMDDNEYPPSKEDLEEFKKQIKESKPEIANNYFYDVNAIHSADVQTEEPISNTHESLSHDSIAMLDLPPSPMRR